MNRNVHLAIGIILFLIFVFATGILHRGVIFLLVPGTGAVAAGSLLPDILEPPSTARHRGIFHGRRVLLVTLAGFILTAAAVMGNPATPRLPLIFTCSAFLLGYAAHLLADSLTPSGLPA